MKLNDRETYLLSFLADGGHIVSPELALVMLEPLLKQKGQAVHKGRAKSYRNSYVYRMLLKLKKANVLRQHYQAHPNAQVAYNAYMLGPEAWKYVDHPRARKLGRKPFVSVKHNLLTAHFLASLDIASQKSPRWEYKVREHGAEPVLRVEGEWSMKLDKLVEIHDHQSRRRFYYFIESDTGTADLYSSTNRRNVVTKVEKFVAFRDKPGFQDTFGIRGALLLFLLPDEEEKRRKDIYDTIYGPTDKDAEAKRLKHNFAKPRRRPKIPRTNIFRAMCFKPWMLTKPMILMEWLCNVK
jgi:hypothetical protein